MVFGEILFRCFLNFFKEEFFGRIVFLKIKYFLSIYVLEDMFKNFMFKKEVLVYFKIVF